MYFISICIHHGETNFLRTKGDGHKRCVKCRSEAVQRRRDKVKQMAVDYKGGKCQRCSYNKCTRALEFHHIDPNEKDFGIGYKGHTKAWEKIKVELDKCMLLCANCHREVHDENSSI